MKNKKYIDAENFVLYNDDCFKRLKKIEPKSIDMIFADPPYFLSNGGVSCHSGKQVSVNKGEWDKSVTIEEKIKFNRKWIRLCREVLKDDGTIWISGTLHNIYVIGMTLELEGFSIINNITWQKPNPAPNLACRCFTNSTETILWASKGKNKTFNYNEMFKVNNEEMHDVWNLPAVQMHEKKFGYHPTQKPECLLERIIIATTNEKDVVLDPFMGSGTTGYVAKKLNRHFIGIEKEKKYFDIAQNRISSIN